MAGSKVEFEVFLQFNRKKPKRAGVKITGNPSTYVTDETTWYFAGADLDNKTVTYTNIKPGSTY